MDNGQKRKALNYLTCIHYMETNGLRFKSKCKEDLKIVLNQDLKSFKDLIIHKCIRNMLINKSKRESRNNKLNKLIRKY